MKNTKCDSVNNRVFVAKNIKMFFLRLLNPFSKQEKPRKRDARQGIVNYK